MVVIGASGFVGSAIVSGLSAAGIRNLACSSAQVDLTQPSSVDFLRATVRPDDALVIASAITPDKGKDVNTLMRNLAMGQNVSAFLETSACSQLVYISSDAVYADDEHPVKEESSCSPASFHGLMHFARERMLLYPLQNHRIPCLILRPSLMYGASDTHNGYGPNRFMRSATREQRITLFGNGEEKRDHVYIADLGRLVTLCLMHRSEGVLNVATGVSVSFSKVAQAVAELVDEEVMLECLPRATAVTHRHFDITGIIKAFPSFQYTALQAGLAESIRNID